MGHVVQVTGHGAQSLLSGRSELGGERRDSRSDNIEHRLGSIACQRGIAHRRGQGDCIQRVPERGQEVIGYVSRLTERKVDSSRTCLKIRPAEPIVLSGELQSHVAVMEAGKDTRGERVVERRHPDAFKGTGARCRDLEHRDILQMHVAIGHQPSEERTGE